MNIKCGVTRRGWTTAPRPAIRPRQMQVSDLRIALFSGNYNYVRDGANQALNKLMRHALDQGAHVRVYSPTTETPAFEPVGDLVSAPAIGLPFGRGEYKLALPLTAGLRRDLDRFAPNMVQLAAPDPLGHSAGRWARGRGIASVASVHTRFETYPSYYNLGFLESTLIGILKRFYNRADMLLTPGLGMEALLSGWGVRTPMRPWSRGVDHARFNPAARSLEWRRSLGIGDDEIVVGFLGRLVLEKGLDVFADVVNRLGERGVAHRVMVIGDGPARDWFAERAPTAVFAGFQAGDALGRAVASLDVFFNPSRTESFGNVTLEAMACGVPVVAARATGAIGLVEEGVSGLLFDPEDRQGYAAGIARLIQDVEFRRAAGTAGHAIAQAYHWDRINQAALEACVELVERRDVRT